MPNHVKNRVTVRGDGALARVRLIVRGVDEDGEPTPFDFERILPMPKELEASFHQWRGPGSPSGMPAWYEWRVENWGTKWNAYEVTETPEGYEFLTAWTTPARAIMELSRLVPGATIEVEYADEDIGRNCGTYVVEKGEVVMIDNPQDHGYIVSENFAKKLWNYE